MTLDDAIAAKLVDVLERLDRRLAAENAETLTPEQAMERLGCKRRKLFLLIEDGKLQRTRVGKKIRITADSVRELQEENARARSR